MHFKNVISGLGICCTLLFSSVSGKAVAAKDDCSEIKALLDNPLIWVKNFDCVSNKAGEVTEVTLTYEDELPEEVSKKIFNYPTITKIDYTVSNSWIDFREKPITNLYIDKIDNLESFSLGFASYDSSVKGKLYGNKEKLDIELLRSLSNVKRLTLKGFVMTYEIYEELFNNFPNLKLLELVNCEMNEYDNFDGLCTKSICDFTRSDDDFTVPEESSTPDYFYSVKFKGNLNSNNFYLGVSELKEYKSFNIFNVDSTSSAKYRTWHVSSKNEPSLLYLSDGTYGNAGNPTDLCLDLGKYTNSNGFNYLSIVKCSEAKHKFQFRNYYKIIEVYDLNNVRLVDDSYESLCLYYSMTPRTELCDGEYSSQTKWSAYYIKN